MNKKLLIIVGILFLFIPLIKAQEKVIKIWPDKIPGSIENKTYKEVVTRNENGINRIWKVKTPTLTVFIPEKNKANGTAIVICPGGGYGHLAYAKEGVAVAKRFNEMGITAFILKYRLPSDSIMINKSIGPLQDVQEAMRIVRRNSKEWDINPNKIGIVGFSAGGHLASTLCTHYNANVYKHDSISAKPDFSILLYPVISMKENITHMGSRNNLLGMNPSESEIKYFSNELYVNKNTPPAFLALAENDKTVPVQNSINYFLALKKYNIPAELHIFQKGGHGFGLGKEDEPNSKWPKLCEEWMKSEGFLSN